MPKLLITGVSGHLGGALAPAAHAAGWEVVGTWLRHRPPGGAPWRTAPLDVRDAAAVRALLTAEAPDAVIHTAYVQDGDQAAAVTTGGARHVAAAAAACGARLVHLSSDAVFTGDLGRPLREEDPSRPSPPTAG
nr:sugar nucleotide-binding protein [Baekduia soli]